MSTFEVNLTEFSDYISCCHERYMQEAAEAIEGWVVLSQSDLSDDWLIKAAESIVDKIATVQNEDHKSTLQALFTSIGKDWITQVIVDGKTVNDRLQEMFDIENAKHVKKTGSSLEWNQWHQDNKDKLGRRIVMAGLMAGKRVEASVPVPAFGEERHNQRIRIQVRGYVPNELNPLALYAWKKYCHAHGFPQRNIGTYQQASSSPQKLPTAVTIGFTSLADHIADDKGTFGQFKEDEESHDSLIEKTNTYATDTVRLFGKDLSDLAAARGVDWPRFLLIDGKTVYDRMKEMHGTLYPQNTPEFNVWYKSNRNEIGFQIMAAGLMTEKRVEAWIPNLDGTLPDHPIQIQKTGYTPDEADPLALYAWKKYCDDFEFEYATGLGFTGTWTGTYQDALQKQKDIDKYPDLAAEVASPSTEPVLRRNQEARAMRETQKWIYAYNLDHTASKSVDSPAMLNMFFGEYLRGFDGSWDNFKEQFHDSAFQDASTAVAACICYLAAQKTPDGNFKYNIRDILDPTKLQKEKKEAAEEYMKRALRYGKEEKNDFRWLGSVFFHGQQAILDQLDKLMKHTDWNDSRQRKTMLPILYGAGSALLHVNPMVRTLGSDIYAGYKNAVQCARTSQQDDTVNLMNTVTNQAANVGTFVQTLYKGEKARMTLADSQDETSLKEAVADLATEQWAIQQQAANTGWFQWSRPFRDTVPRASDIESLNGIAKESNVAKMFAKEVAQQPNGWKEKASDILRGSINHAFIFHKDKQANEIKLLISTNLRNELQIEQGTSVKSPSPVDSKEMLPTYGLILE